MKMILLVSAICLFLMNNTSFAAEGYIFTATEAQNALSFSQSLQYKNMPYGEYLKYYAGA